MSNSGIGSGADSFFEDEEEPDHDDPTDDTDETSDTSNTSESSDTETGDRARDRKQIAMYLPEGVTEALQKGFNRYKIDHPDATKNSDFYPEIIEAGLEALGVADE